MSKYYKFLVHLGDDTYHNIMLGDQLTVISDVENPMIPQYAFKYSVGGSITLKSGVIVTLTSISSGAANCDFTLSNGNETISYFEVHEGSHGSSNTIIQESGYASCYDYDSNYYLDRINIYMFDEGDDYLTLTDFDESYVKNIP